MKPDHILLLSHAGMYLIMYITLPMLIKNWMANSTSMKVPYWPHIAFQCFVALSGAFLSLSIWHEVRDRLVISHIQEILWSEHMPWFLALSSIHAIILVALVFFYLVGNWVGRLNLIHTDDEKDILQKFAASTLFGLTISFGIVSILDQGIPYLVNMLFPSIDQYLFN